jgi:hypothetical protein
VFNAMGDGGAGGGESALPAPAEVEAGSALLLFAVNELGLPVVDSKDGATLTVISILFPPSSRDNANSSLHYFKHVATRIIKVYGSVLVDLFLQWVPPAVVPIAATTCASGEAVSCVGGGGRGQEVLEVLVRTLGRAASSPRAEAGAEHSCAKTLLRKVLSGKIHVNRSLFFYYSLKILRYCVEMNL